MLFLALVGGGFAVVEMDRAQGQLAEDQLVLAEAAAIRAGFENELYRTLNLASGLQAYVTSHPGLESPDRLELMLSTLHQHGKHVRNVALAPDDVIEVVHPLEGNEAALGLDYRDVPEQWAAVQQARVTRTSVLDGPLDLVQGGRGLVNRTPVFRDDGTYWGTIALVIDVDSLVEAVREDHTPQLPVEWAVRAWSNYAEATPVTGDAALFDGPQVHQSFDVPDGSWVVAANAADPGAAPAGRAIVGRIVTVVVAAVLAALVFEVVRERWRVVSLSLHDPLTGLPNRRLLEERIERSVAWAARRDRPFVLAFLDLDRFKAVNDTHGHRAGDHVLREVARRLEGRVRATDTVARVGGDEFVVLLPEAHPHDVDELVRGLEEVVREPIPYQGRELVVGTSAGVAVYPRDGHDAVELITRADEWMYLAKQRRREVAEV